MRSMAFKVIQPILFLTLFDLIHFSQEAKTFVHASAIEFLWHICFLHNFQPYGDYNKTTSNDKKIVMFNEILIIIDFLIVF